MTLRLSDALLLRLPLTPWRVSAAGPIRAEADAVNRRVELPPTVTTGGLKVAVTPAGKPISAKVTLPWKPPEPVTLTGDVAVAPRFSVKDEEAAPRLNPGINTGAAQEWTARYTFNRPPVVVFDASDGIASTLSSKACFSPAVDKAQADRTSAAEPDTCAVAMEVPLQD